jgi:hypothetical protein
MMPVWYFPNLDLSAAGIVQRRFCFDFIGIRLASGFSPRDELAYRFFAK